jgi:hypothetical protein
LEAGLAALFVVVPAKTAAKISTRRKVANFRFGNRRDDLGWSDNRSGGRNCGRLLSLRIFRGLLGTGVRGFLGEGGRQQEARH